MLSQKLAALFALVMVFASQGVIGLPYPSPDDGSPVDDLEIGVADILSSAASFFGDLSLKSKQGQ
jgi:hypothetical protein